MAPHPYTKPRLIRLSRALSHALRHVLHQHKSGGEEQGWIAIDDLLDALRQEKAWRNIKRTDLEEMVTKSGKLRFEIKDDQIRSLPPANHGEKSIMHAAKPPNILYHEADAALAGRIRVHGLIPESHRYIHLAATSQDAIEMGQPGAGRAIILKIDAARASDSGVQFYEDSNHTWLTEAVPPEFISWD